MTFFSIKTTALMELQPTQHFHYSKKVWFNVEAIVSYLQKRSFGNTNQQNWQKEFSWFIPAGFCSVNFSVIFTT